MTSFAPSLLQILHKTAELKQATDVMKINLASVQLLVEAHLHNASAKNSVQDHASEILDSFVIIIEKFSGTDVAKACAATLCILVINFFEEMPESVVLRHIKSILRTINVLYCIIFRPLSLDGAQSSTNHLGVVTASIASMTTLAQVLWPLLWHTSLLVVPQDAKTKFREIIMLFVTKDSINKFGLVLSKLKELDVRSAPSDDEDRLSTTLLSICKLLTIASQIDHMKSDTTRSLVTRLFSNASLCSHIVQEAGISYCLMHNLMLCETGNAQPVTLKFLEKYLATYMVSLEHYFGSLEKDILDLASREAAINSYKTLTILLGNILGIVQYNEYLYEYLYDSVMRGFLYRVGKLGTTHLDDQSLVVHGFGVFLLIKYDYEARADETSREESSKLLELIKKRMKKLKMDVDFQESGGSEKLERQMLQLIDKCAWCNKDGTQLLLETGHRLKQCSRCLRAYYCNADCQRKAWATHKLVCVPSTQPPTAQEFAASKLNPK